MPSFFIRPRSVLGCSPSFRAAPLSPSITQSVARSTSRMWLRCLSARLVATGGAAACAGPAPAALVSCTRAPGFAAAAIQLKTANQTEPLQEDHIAN